MTDKFKLIDILYNKPTAAEDEESFFNNDPKLPSSPGPKKYGLADLVRDYQLSCGQVSNPYNVDMGQQWDNTNSAKLLPAQVQPSYSLINLVRDYQLPSGQEPDYFCAPKPEQHWNNDNDTNLPAPQKSAYSLLDLLKDNVTGFSVGEGEESEKVKLASSGTKSKPTQRSPLIHNNEQNGRIEKYLNNPYSEILQANGLPLNSKINNTSWTPTSPGSGGGPWKLVFSSEKNHGYVTLYDENKNVIFSCPATSGRIGVTDRSIQDKGPIPLGSYTLDPKEISGGLGKAIERNILLGEDWGFYRVPLKSQGGIDSIRGEFFIHGGLFPGTAGCIDIGLDDLKLFPLLMQHEGLINVEVIEEPPNDLLIPNGQQYFNA